MTADVNDYGVASGTQVLENIPDSFKVVQGDIIPNVFVWSKENGFSFGGSDLQRSDPGIEILSRQLSLQVVQAGLPVCLGHSGIYQKPLSIAAEPKSAAPNG